MEPVVAAALINGPITLLVGTLTYHVGRSQTRSAKQTALETAQSSYQTTLEAARRAPQREAYAQLVSSTRLYLARTHHVLEAAKQLDEHAEPAGGFNVDDRSGLLVPMKEIGLIPEITSKLTSWINQANAPAPVLEAAAVVCLEGPVGGVTRAAEKVERLAEALHDRLSNAGHWPEREEKKPDPDRSTEAHNELEHAIGIFIKVARAHLNGHQPLPGVLPQQQRRPRPVGKRGRRFLFLAR
ncbi:hypothetical protein [Streptomyces sp. NPDC001750]|uniref:hypothetical protein n=1 Tax=Streptomyces sp. NPDC001750 TaxID=3364607 RepID=UPI003683AB34